MQQQEISEKAANWMLNRGWKKLTAKRRECVYPERSRRKQSLFEHTMVELDAPIIFMNSFRFQGRNFLSGSRWRGGRSIE